MNKTLEGKTAVITGAGRGIGRSIAEALAETGANIVIADVQGAEETAREMQDQGIQTLGLEVDVTKADSVEKMVNATTEKFDSIDILVNNAGITRDGLFLRMKEEDWDLVLEINLKGAFNCCKAAVRSLMKSESGRIINIASVVGVMGNAGQVNYSASKAGMIGLTKSLAKELAARKVTVNAVAPGFIQTAMTDKLSDSVKEQILGAIPMKAMGLPEDVASAVAFLASPQAGYITGHVLHIDGGLAM